MVPALLEIEEQGWRALSSPGNAGREFYDAMLRDDAVMLFTGGLRLLGKKDILASFAAQPWQHFTMEDPKQLELAEDVAVLVYRVTARREGTAPYRALVSSTYTNTQGKWKLAVHQQTPV
jgi:ketosteroid isomerase-like protein